MVDRKASGQFVLRTGGKLHASLRRYARKKGISLNRACVDLLERALAETPAVGPGIPLPFIVKEIQATFAERLEAIILFGSAARGETWQAGASDVDLLLVLRPGQALTRNLYSEWDDQLAGLRPWKVSPQFAEFPANVESLGGLWLEVAVDGRVLWDPRGEVSRILSALRQSILSGRWRRRLLHGQGYWVREEAVDEER
jgi:predicted nucleotidyltransferase